MNKSNKFSPEFRSRAVWMVQEHRDGYPSLCGRWSTQSPRRSAVCRKPCWSGSGAPARFFVPPALFRPSGARPQSQILNASIDQHRDTYGVEPICNVLQVAPSAYRRHAARRRNPDLRSARTQHDALFGNGICS